MITEEVMEQAGLLPEEELNLTEGDGEEESPRKAAAGEATDEDLGAFRDFVEGLDLDSLLGN